MRRLVFDVWQGTGLVRCSAYWEGEEPFLRRRAPKKNRFLGRRTIDSVSPWMDRIWNVLPILEEDLVMGLLEDAFLFAWDQFGESIPGPHFPFYCTIIARAGAQKRIFGYGTEHDEKTPFVARGDSVLLEGKMPVSPLSADFFARLSNYHLQRDDLRGMLGYVAAQGYILKNED